MFTFLRVPYYKLLAKNLIKKYAYNRKEFEDRDVLERIIFPYVLAYFNPKKILDIGREDYQEFYTIFFAAVNFGLLILTRENLNSARSTT